MDNIIEWSGFITDMGGPRINQNKAALFSGALASAHRCVKLSGGEFLCRIGIAGIDPDTGSGLIRLDIDTPFKITNHSVFTALVGLTVKAEHVIVASGEPDEQVSFSFLFPDMLSSPTANSKERIATPHITSSTNSFQNESTRGTTYHRLFAAAKKLVAEPNSTCSGHVDCSDFDCSIHLQLLLPALLFTNVRKECFASVLTLARTMAAELGTLRDDEMLSLIVASKT